MVDLKEFVEATVLQIVAGVKAAQTQENGEHVNAASGGGTLGGNLFVGSHGTFTRVDFDVAVTAEASVKGGASLKVIVGAEASGSKSDQSVSRIAFSVPVRLPEGDQSREQAHEEKEQAKRNKRSPGGGGSSWAG